MDPLFFSFNMEKSTNNSGFSFLSLDCQHSDFRRYSFNERSCNVRDAASSNWDMLRKPRPLKNRPKIICTEETIRQTSVLLQEMVNMVMFTYPLIDGSLSDLNYQSNRCNLEGHKINSATTGTCCFWYFYW